MQGEIEERQERHPRKRRKKKSKFGYYLYAIVILILTITNITLSILLLTHVQKIEVQGTKLSDEEAIVEWITEDPLTNNALYTFWKYNYSSYEKPIYLQEVKVGLGAPWKIRVSVTEKEIIAGFLQDEVYVYFDKDGLVMDVTEVRKADVPLVDGLQVEDVKQFEPLVVENEKLFSYIDKVSREVKKQELTPDRYVWEEDSMTLYFGGVCVQLGKSNYDVKVEQLPAILLDLEGKEGVLHMEHYSEIGEKISFELNIPEEETDSEGTGESGEVTEEQSGEAT